MGQDGEKMVRRYYLIVFCILFFLAGCGEEDKREKETTVFTEEQRIIVAAGDSLTFGYGVSEEEKYPYLLEEKLRESGYNYRVINAGVSAETSSGLLSRLEWILTLQPEIVILETGANDGLRGIDPGLIEENLQKIITSLLERDIVVLLAGMKMVWNLGPFYVKQFDNIYPKLAEEYKLIFFPFFLQGVAMQSSLNLPDGIHPNGQGYEKIVDNIFPYVLDAIVENENNER